MNDWVKQSSLFGPETPLAVCTSWYAWVVVNLRYGGTLSFVVATNYAPFPFPMEQMESEGHKCTSIEGGMDKMARDRVIREFRYDWCLTMLL